MRHRLRRGSGVVTLVVTLALIQSSCELDEVDLPERNENTVTVTHLGSLGNSLTAGFINGGLHEKGQIASFANLLSRTMTGRQMQMPLIGDPGLGSESGYSPLFVTPTGSITREPLTVDPLQMAKNLKYPVPYDNLGVPGATTKQILNVRFASEARNPLFDLILRNSALPGGGTCMGQLERLQPEIITAWSGNNEILGGATSGEPQNTDPNAPGYVVPLADFQVEFRALCDRIATLQPRIVAIANIPAITKIPFTRFFGTGPLPGINRWVMEEDLDGDGDMVELVLLTAPISRCPGCFLPGCKSPGTPCDTIPAENTLTFAETALITEAIAAYNTFIRAEVEARGWALVDIYAVFEALAANPTECLNARFPLVVNPLTGAASQNKQSAFSLDGIHPSERGHGSLANAFIESINEKYGTTYPSFNLCNIPNIAGFERFQGPGKAEIPVITAEAEQGFQSLVEMFQGGPFQP